MPAYISLGTFTEQGVKDIKHTVDRAKAVHETAKAAGGRVIGIWWTQGSYDFVFIFEAPDDETAAQYLLMNALQGNNRTVTLRAFSEEEMERIVSRLP